TAGDITTTNDAIDFQNNVVFTGNSSISSASGGGNITFAGTVNGTTDYAQDINLTAGTGSISFNSTAGASIDLGDIVVVSAQNVTFLGTLFADSLTQTAGTGETRFNAAVTINSSSSIDAAITTNAVTINSTLTTLNGGSVTITNAGLLDIAPGADMSLDGLFLQNGAGAVQTAGDI
ncbi:MAG: hypothetical protein ACKPJJ_18180, partial [Planctomycetaceae bacterium]